MKRSERLERINAVNHGLENMAGAKLAGVYEEYTAQLNQLEQLRIYKDDYAEQLREKMQSDLSSQEIRDYKYFFASIENAIKQQESMVEHVRKKLEKCREEWLGRRSEVEKLNAAGDNMKREEAREEARKEQKLSDELGMLMSRMHPRISH